MGTVNKADSLDGNAHEHKMFRTMYCTEACVAGNAAMLDVSDTENGLGYSVETADSTDSARAQGLGCGIFSVTNTVATGIYTSVQTRGKYENANVHANTVAGDLLIPGPTSGRLQPVSVGGTVTQTATKATAVTLSTTAGQITMNNAALNAATEVSFTLTNTAIRSTDTIVVNHASAGTAGAYLVGVSAVADGSCVITVANLSAGALSEAIVLNFMVLGGGTVVAVALEAAVTNRADVMLLDPFNLSEN